MTTNRLIVVAQDSFPVNQRVLEIFLGQIVLNLGSTTMYKYLVVRTGSHKNLLNL